MEKLCRVVFVYQDGENAADAALAPVFTGDTASFFPRVCENEITLFAGLGKYETQKPGNLKDIAGKTAKKVKELKLKSVQVEIGHLCERFSKTAAFELVQGFELGTYSFEGYKRKKEDEKEETKTEFTYTANGVALTGETAEAAAHAKNLAVGVMTARNLVNTPANMLTPIAFADKVTELFAGTKVEVEVLDEKQCAALGMGSFLAIGNSSANPPRLIVMRYRGNESSDEVLGYVGKGLTFDTGGYSLKTSMLGMKTDMAGAAAVTGTMYAIGKNCPKVNVVGILVCCENRLSNSAILPGDVITAMNGKTIEVVNTDAEGRLVLADGLTYAVRNEKATKLVDIATLTGSIAATLGPHAAGVFTNNDGFMKEFMDCSNVSFENFWQLPINDLYRKEIRSDIADMKNSGKTAGAIFGACFLEEFTDEKPWIHVDIAGVGNAEAPAYGYQSKGATGVGVMTLYALAAK